MAVSCWEMVGKAGRTYGVHHPQFEVDGEIPGGDALQKVFLDGSASDLVWFWDLSVDSMVDHSLCEACVHLERLLDNGSSKPKGGLLACESVMDREES